MNILTKEQVIDLMLSLRPILKLAQVANDEETAMLVSQYKLLISGFESLLSQTFLTPFPEHHKSIIERFDQSIQLLKTGSPVLDQDLKTETESNLNNVINILSYKKQPKKD